MKSWKFGRIARAALPLLVIGQLSLLPACRQQPEEPAASGEELFVEQCTLCHGAGGAGDTMMGAPHPNANLTDQQWQNGPELEKIEAVIRTGVPGTSMPSFADTLTPEEIRAVAQYVQALSR